MILQLKLSVKAPEAFMSLSVGDSLVYEKVKGPLLCMYEVVPGAHGHHFHSVRKDSAHTYADFAKVKGILFDLWCCTCKVVPNSRFFTNPKIHLLLVSLHPLPK